MELKKYYLVDSLSKKFVNTQGIITIDTVSVQFVLVDLPEQATVFPSHERARLFASFLTKDQEIIDYSYTDKRKKTITGIIAAVYSLTTTLENEGF